MKVAVILLHTAQGWSASVCGSDIAAIKAQFKGIKIAGVATAGDLPADEACLLATDGTVTRKRLDDPTTVASRARVAAAEEARLKREAEAAAAATAQDLTAQASAAAVAAVTQVVAEAAGVAAEAVAEPVPAPAAPAPQAEAPAEAEESPAAHFGGGKRKR